MHAKQRLTEAFEVLENNNVDVPQVKQRNNFAKKRRVVVAGRIGVLSSEESAHQ